MQASQRCPRVKAGAAAAPASTAARPPEPAPPVPGSIHDVDNGRILGFGAELAEGHPGFYDESYKKRRSWIAQLAKSHVIGQPIPEVDYLPEEQETWRAVLLRLQGLIPRYGCQEFVASFNAFKFDPAVVPQLQDVHMRLQDATGWSVRPVAGLMHPRDFLNGLAFKYFHSTQYALVSRYMRHHENPMYTPEPDLCHELIGHVPMLLNTDFCDLVEAIGRASLGATDAEIWHLTKVYWFTVEFGVVKQAGDVKAFGAGILSSFGELEWMGSGKAIVEPLDPWAPQPKMSYKDGFQKHYFSLDSFEQGASLLKRYAAHLEATRSA